EEVSRGKSQQVGVRAVATDDAEHGAPLTMPRVAALAALARAAPGVDLADHARAARQISAAGILHDAHELVADRAAKARVAARDLEIGVADPRGAHAHERFAVRARLGDFGERETGVVDAKGAHGILLMHERPDRVSLRFHLAVRVPRLDADSRARREIRAHGRARADAARAAPRARRDEGAGRNSGEAGVHVLRRLAERAR